MRESMLLHRSCSLLMELSVVLQLLYYLPKICSFSLFRLFVSSRIHCYLSIDSHVSDKELIGIGSASLGLSSCFDAPFRMWKCTFQLALDVRFRSRHSHRRDLTFSIVWDPVTRHRKKYGPLYFPDLWHEDPSILPAGQGRVMRKMPRNWWHLDFSMWT